MSHRQAKAATLGLLGRDLQTLTPPDPLHALVVHNPARIAQQGRDRPVAIAAISARQLDEVGRELLLVVSAPRHLALC
jgi:hypothetical protein